MKKFLFTLVIAVLAGQVFSQRTDSLQVVRTTDSLLTAAEQLWRAKQYAAALPPAQHAADLSKQIWGEQNIIYAASLHRIASIYAETGQEESAEQLYLQAILLRGQLLGKQHPDYGKSLNNLATLYAETGRPEQATPLFTEVAQLWASVLGKEHPAYLQCIQNLAQAYINQGNYQDAEPLYLELVAGKAKTVGKGHFSYAEAIEQLAILYVMEEEYAKAEPLLLQSREILINSVGKEDMHYTKLLANLALLYVQKGDYAKAKQLYTECIRIDTATVGKEDSNYDLVLHGLADLYLLEGSYMQAEPLYLESAKICAETRKKGNRNCQDVLTNLALLYREKGDYRKAESMLLDMLAVSGKTVGENSPDYAAVLNTLAGVYAIQNDYAKAEPLFLQTKAIQLKTLGPENSSYATSLSNLSGVALYKGAYAQAETLAVEAADIWEKIKGPDHPDYAFALGNLGNIYYMQGKFTQAETVYKQALLIQTKAVGAASPAAVGYLRNLAILYQATKRVPEAATAFLTTAGYDRTLLNTEASYSSENQMLAYLPAFDENMAGYLSFLQVHPTPSLLGTGLDNALFMHGLLLANARYLARSVSTVDPSTRETYNNWQAAQRRLAQEYAKPTSERQHVGEVEAEAEKYEKALLRKLPAFRETRGLPHWQDVREQLKIGEAALEFVSYRYYKPGLTDSVLYAAFVLLPGESQPQFIPLFEEKELIHLVGKAPASSNFMKINALYAPKISADKHKSLYELIWQPLQNQLQGVTTVYYSPAGLLHRLNLGAIPDEQGKAFGDQKQLVLLGSTRQLVVPNAGTQKVSSTAYLVGGIRYESDSIAVAVANQQIASRSFDPTGVPEFQPDSSSSTRGGVLDYLPSTATEVDEIGRLLKAGKINVQTDTGFYATEEAFRRLGVGAPSPRIIHLATHGYFFPDPKSTKTSTGFGQEPVFKISEHPMIRSGLILAGAKQAWLTGKHPQNQEDGVLTAYEISQMNLSNTELVVLSACETGLGDIEGNEGVYGLQRAFKIAGAKYLIMSLWKVDDRSTKDFMTAFYTRWLTEKLPIPQAFRAAQQDTRIKHPSAYDWAGFVLIE